jgi:hypothetical protein
MLVAVLHECLVSHREPLMSATAPPPPDRDPLENLLKDAENELRRRLEEACEAEARGVSSESTEEIRQLEDSLLSAALAAKQTIAVRRHMKRRGYAERERPVKIDLEEDHDAGTDALKERESESETGTAGVREFVDSSGQRWRAWLVVPGQTRSSASGRRFLGNFQNGWICFEGLGNSARRRLPFHQASWASVTDDELRRLVEQGIDAPIRVTKHQEKR